MQNGRPLKPRYLIIKMNVERRCIILIVNKRTTSSVNFRRRMRACQSLSFEHSFSSVLISFLNHGDNGFNKVSTANNHVDGGDFKEKVFKKRGK